MRGPSRMLLLFSLLTAGCAGPGAAAPACPPPAPCPEPPPCPAADPLIIGSEPAANAATGLEAYGRLVGSWDCKVEQRQEDGTWTGRSQATWTFFYALGGHAVQDVWAPAADGPVGTNLRIYDPVTQRWQMVWAAAGQSFFDQFEATADKDTIVMYGERRARKAFGAHRARITFHDIAADRFSWRYEATAPGADGPWQPIQRIACTRR